MGHSYEVDIWALGVIAYTLLVGRAPFETRDINETYMKIQRASYSFPRHVTLSDSSKDLISKLLQTDPCKRIKLEMILNHDFFKEGYPLLMSVTTLTIPPSIAYTESYKPATPKASKEYNNKK
jgi:serine/threonine protein kinase